MIMVLDPRTATYGDAVYLFSGFLICRSCGGRLTRKTNTVKGKKYICYHCPTGKRNGCKTPVMVREDELITCVTESLQAYIRNVEFRMSDPYVKDTSNIATLLTYDDGGALLESVGTYAGQDGVYRYTNLSNWYSGRLRFVSPTQHLGKYVSFKFRLEQAGSLAMQIQYDMYGGRGSAVFPDFVKFYVDGEETDVSGGFTQNVWYTVVIDLTGGNTGIDAGSGDDGLYFTTNVESQSVDYIADLVISDTYPMAAQ